MSIPLPPVPATVYAPGVEVESADLNALESFSLALKTLVESGLWTRATLADASPVIATTDQDGNVKNWIDASGYNFGAVLSETYWWYSSGALAANANASMGSPFYVTQRDAGFSVSGVSAPAAQLGCRMLKIDCAASPAFGAGAYVSCKGAVGDTKVISNLADCVAVFETTFITEITATSASSFYAGFHDGGTVATLESSAYPSCCILLDYGESAFEGMSCDGTTNSKLATGVTCLINTLYHLRVEYHGANTPRGVAASGPVARFFIDGVLALTKTTNLPVAGQQLGPFFGVKAFSTGTQTDIHLGPVHWSANYLPSSQVPA